MPPIFLFLFKILCCSLAPPDSNLSHGWHRTWMTCFDINHFMAIAIFKINTLSIFLNFHGFLTFKIFLIILMLNDQIFQRSSRTIFQDFLELSKRDFFLDEFHFRWLKFKGVYAAFPISITLFSYHLKLNS